VLQPLLGQVALVTGAGLGIGRAIAILFAINGAKVVVVDFNETAAKETVTIIQKNSSSSNQKEGDVTSISVQCDVKDDKQLEFAFDEAIRRFGRLDIVVNNAGIAMTQGEFAIFLDASDEKTWRRGMDLMDINFKAVIVGSRLAVQRLVKNPNGGTIINMASVFGLRPVATAPLYAATKTGIINFTRSLGWGLSLSPSTDKIRVHAICPAFVDTPLTRAASEEAQKFASEAFGGFLTPESIADVALLLTHQKGNGQIVTVTVPDGIQFLPEAKL